MSGVARQYAELSTEQRLSVAAELGRQARRVHALRPSGAVTHADWPALNAAAAAEHTSLPPHPIAQIDDSLVGQEPERSPVVQPVLGQYGCAHRVVAGLPGRQEEGHRAAQRVVLRAGHARAPGERQHQLDAGSSPVTRQKATPNPTDPLAALEDGSIQAQIEPIVLHELSYVLPRFMRQMTRKDVVAYLLGVLRWPGVRGEKDLLTDALQRWGRTPGLGFADAYLAVLASRRQCSVYTKNVQELTRQGVDVPDPLPNSGDQ